MTTIGDGHANSADSCSTRPSAALVHVPMTREFLAALVHSSGSVEGLLQELRGDLVLRPPSALPTPAVPAPEPAITERVRTVSLVPARPQQAGHGADVVLVRRVDGQLRTLLAQVKWSSHTRERERARLGIFAALNARRAVLESRTVDGWKPTVAEFARTWLGVRRADEDWLEAVSTALIGAWVDLLEEHLLDEVAEPGLEHLKKESSTIHRQLQPLFQRKTHGARLLSLDHPAPGGALLDLVTDSASPNQNLLLWEPEGDRAAAVFARLPRHEQDLARTWATAAPGSTWTEFADLAGVSVRDADNFRRKLRRLGRQHTHAGRRTRSNP